MTKEELKRDINLFMYEYIDGYADHEDTLEDIINASRYYYKQKVLNLLCYIPLSILIYHIIKTIIN